MVAALIAPGFEEIEACVPIDLLRRAGIEVCVVGVGGTLITGSHDITIQCDVSIDAYHHIPDALLIPGGMPGSANLAASPQVSALIKEVAQSGIIAALCAAPAVVLEPLGILKGTCTCYPSYKDAIKSATVIDQAVVVNGNLITAPAAGAVFQFALRLISLLTNSATADRVAGSILYP